MIEPLFALLRQRANRRGRTMAHARWLEATLGCSSQDLAAALDALGRSGRIHILSPLPWLIATLPGVRHAVAAKRPSWSGSSPANAHSKPQISSHRSSVHREVPVSSSAAAAATQQREDGGAGEEGALLDQVLQILGPEAKREEFRAIIAGLPAALIHRCLRRVQATRSIRVSRAALFRSLIERFRH